MRKVLKYATFTLISLILFILIYLGCAWGLSHITVHAEHNTQADITIYLKSNGVHTDLVLPIKTPAKDWSKTVLYKNTRSGDTTFNYVAFGWGDKGFYLETPTWADLKASTAFKAAFGLSSSAMHTTFYCELKESKRCIRLALANEQYQRLVTFIEKSFQPDTTGMPLAIGAKARYGNNDAFYEGKGSYNLFHTCNTWTNDALKACGQKACLWTPFDKGILYQYGH
jgi:uncharacterized protein (TIGR02117 family)